MHSLYQCGHARIKDDKIYCDKGKLVPLSIRNLVEGKKLEFTICQLCTDYDEIGDSVPDSERGWKEE
jgi:hypothetical protein